MVITTLKKIDNKTLVYTYSDENYMILQNETGVTYEEAYDIEGKGYTYSETDIKIKRDTEENSNSEE